MNYDCHVAKELDIMAFCELRPVTEAQDVARVALGSVYAFADIVERSRGTRHNPGDKVNRPWFPGVMLKSDTDSGANKVHATFSFNHKNQGWNYAWFQAQKKLSVKFVQHELHMFILAGPRNTSEFTVVCELSSSSFNLRSRASRSNATLGSSGAQAASEGRSQNSKKRSAAKMINSPASRPLPNPPKRHAESRSGESPTVPGPLATHHTLTPPRIDRPSDNIVMQIKLLEARQQELQQQLQQQLQRQDQQEGRLLKPMDMVCKDPGPVEASRDVAQPAAPASAAPLDLLLSMPVAASSPKTHLIVPVLVPAAPDLTKIGDKDLDAVSLDLLQQIAQASRILEDLERTSGEGGTAAVAPTLLPPTSRVLEVKLEEEMEVKLEEESRVV
jgi:hypothetical protein